MLEVRPGTSGSPDTFAVDADPSIDPPGDLPGALASDPSGALAGDPPGALAGDLPGALPGDPPGALASDPTDDVPEAWSAELIIERLVARAAAEELPADALPPHALPVCCVECQRWPPVRPIARACLRPPRRRHPPRFHLTAGALAACVLLAATAALGLTYQRASAFTAWGLATGYRHTGQRMLAAGHHELALPFFLAARQHGDESDELKALFAAALRARRLEAAAAPRRRDPLPDRRPLAAWRDVVARSPFPTVPAAMAQARRISARSVERREAVTGAAHAHRGF